MLKKLTLFITLLSVIPFAHAQKENPFEFEASYVGDAYGNLAGGIDQGAGFLGMGNLTIAFTTEKAGWWKGGSFFINGASVHGKSPSENFVGDMQIISNIDAGNHAYLHELWFKQDFNAFSFTVGLQDLNAEFLTSDNASEFINSSFGFPPVLACNLPVPIFPLTDLGVSAKWNISEKFAWQATVFDGFQDDFDVNPHNLKWKLDKNHGALAVTEFHSTFNIGDKEGCYKIGGYYHSKLKEFDEETQLTNTIFNNKYGFYLIGDQVLFERENKKIAAFTQIALTPKSKNDHHYYIGLGGNYYGIFSKEGKDVFGVAAAILGFHETSHKHETTLEMHYKWQFNDNFALQPNIQYVINPSGSDENLDNALAAMLRFHINF